MTFHPSLPFGMQDDSQNLYGTLHDGVPAWMEKSLWAWQREILSVLFENPQKAMKRFHTIEQELRTAIDLPANPTEYALSVSVVSHFRARDEGLLLTDYLLSVADLEKLGGWESLQKMIQEEDHLFGRLESTLKKSGSKWAVGIRAAGRIGLIQRVPEGIQLSADETIRNSGHAGRRLAEAWGAAFGIDPDPTKAYGLAVKAVEDAALTKVPLRPSDHKTLGSVIRVLNGPGFDAANCTLDFRREDKHYSNGQTLVAMLKTLWSGQTDRHGGDREYVSEAVISQKAAESAVMLAVPLVNWFTSGFVVTSLPNGKLAPE